MVLFLEGDALFLEFLQKLSRMFLLGPHFLELSFQNRDPRQVLLFPGSGCPRVLLLFVGKDQLVVFLEGKQLCIFGLD